MGISGSGSRKTIKKCGGCPEKKNAPPELVKQIQILKKKEAAIKKKKEKYKKFKQEVPKDGKTRTQLHNEWIKAHRKWNSWRGKREILQIKSPYWYTIY